MKSSIALQLVMDELDSAMVQHGPMLSLHEGYGILLEEVDELFDLVKQKGEFRCKKDVAGEAKQVAAMALRIMIDLC